MSLLRKKSIASMLQEKQTASSGAGGMKKELGVFDLAMLGIGCIVGTGIFVLTGVAAAQHAGPGLILSFILAGIVLFVLLFGQSRLLYAIGRDGLLPKPLAWLNPKTGVPANSTWVTGIVVAIFAGLIPLRKLADLVSIGTLFAFISVSLGIIILRKARPDLERSFKVPLVPWIPVLAVLTCGYLLISLPAVTWVAFLVWMGIGLIVYFAYGYKHSELSKSTRPLGKRME